MRIENLDLNYKGLTFSQISGNSYGHVGDIRNKQGELIFQVFGKVFYCKKDSYPISGEILMAVREVKHIVKNKDYLTNLCDLFVIRLQGLGLPVESFDKLHAFCDANEVLSDFSNMYPIFGNSIMDYNTFTLFWNWYVRWQV